MTLKDSVQTAFLVIGFFTVLVFGASYYFISLDTKPTDQLLKDSLAITASFFGGFATLTAAYIASRLFNDWKDEYNHNLESSILMEYIEKLDIIEETASQLLTTLTLSSKSEMNDLGEEVKDIHPNVLISKVDKQKEEFNNHRLNRWTISNKYQLLDDPKYSENLISMIAFMNEAFEWVKDIESIVDKDDQIKSIKAESVQSYINWALGEVNSCLSILETTYANAIKDIKAYK